MIGWIPDGLDSSQSPRLPMVRRESKLITESSRQVCKPTAFGSRVSSLSLAVYSRNVTCSPPSASATSGVITPYMMPRSA